MFGLGFAILALDFIMRILIIEKKTAAKYKDEDQDDATNGHASQPEQNVEDGHEETEEDPLIPKLESQEYNISPDQPRPIRSFPILYCLKDPRLLTALLLAFVQATLLATFDSTVPTEAQELFNFD